MWVENSDNFQSLRQQTKLEKWANKKVEYTDFLLTLIS
jgi:hypothetical protein